MAPWGRTINVTTVSGFVVTDEFIYSLQERIEAADKLNFFFRYFNIPAPPPPQDGVGNEYISLIDFYRY